MIRSLCQRSCSAESENEYQQHWAITRHFCGIRTIQLLISKITIHTLLVQIQSDSSFFKNYSLHNYLDIFEKNILTFCSRFAMDSNILIPQNPLEDKKHEHLNQNLSFILLISVNTDSLLFMKCIKDSDNYILFLL